MFDLVLNEVEREKNKLAQPEASISIVNYDIGPLLARTAQLEATVENHESLFIEVEKQKLAKIEKDEHVSLFQVIFSES